MIVQGVSLDDIDRLSIDEYNSLFAMYQAGMWGAGLQYTTGYTSMIPHIGGDGKSKLPSLGDVYPQFYEYATFGKSTEPKQTNDSDLSSQAMGVLLSMGGNVPTGLVEASRGSLQEPE